MNTMKGDGDGHHQQTRIETSNSAPVRRSSRWRPAHAAGSRRCRRNDQRDPFRPRAGNLLPAASRNTVPPTSDTTVVRRTPARDRSPPTTRRRAFPRCRRRSRRLAPCPTAPCRNGYLIDLFAPAFALFFRASRVAIPPSTSGGSSMPRYGMMPSARIDMRPSAPPENISNMPRMPPALCAKISCRIAGSIPGCGCRCRADRPRAHRA